MPRYITIVAYDFYKRRIGELCEMFPVVFNKKFPLPLNVGVHEVLPRLTGFSQKEINALLRVWVSRREYASMAVSHGWRYDLAGNPTYKIAEDQLSGFIAIVGRQKGRTLHRWSMAYREKYGRPGFLFVPMDKRPAMEETDGSESTGSNRRPE